MDEIFKHRYDKKRLAPGLVTGQTSVRLFHDCSTLGGNSGGEIVSLETGKAIALHFAGTLFQRNHAVPIAIVLERLEAALRGNPTRSSQNRRSNDPEVNIGTTNGIKLQSTLQGSNGRVIEATVPIHIRIEIGDLVSANGTGALSNAVATSASTLTADDDTFATTEARPEDYLDRPGYDPKFLGDDLEVPLPILVEDEDDTLTFESQGETKQILDYQHFSVLMSRSRRMCRFSAVNIDGKTSQRTTRTGWQYDPRIPKAQQIMKECYGNAPRFSRGHMTRREDPAWGSKADLGNRDSMHATNAVPQMQIFNAGVWLALEDYALQNARQDDMRLCVFTGPFLERNDPIRFEVKVPITFWKVIAFIHDETGELCATGYTMSQKSFISDEQEEFVFGRHESSQRPIREIERRAGLSFGILSDLDPLNESTESQLLPLTSLGQIRFF
jgi:endonuclease G